MPFKSMLQVTVKSFLIIGVIFVVGCSYIFDAKLPPEKPSYNGEFGDQLSKANEVVSDYFKPSRSDDISNEQLNSVVLAYQDVINSFISHTKSGGEDPDSYSPTNVHDLLQGVWDDSSLTVTDISAYIELKAFLIGGRSDQITKGELQIIHDLLPRIAEMAGVLRPYRQLLLTEQGTSRDSEGFEWFEKAFTIVKSELLKFVSSLDRYDEGQSISVDQLMALVGEKIFDISPNKMNQYGPLARSFKNFALNEASNDLHREDLPFFLEQSLETFQAFKQYQIFVYQASKKAIFSNPGYIVAFAVNAKAQVADSSVFRTVTLPALEKLIDRAEGVLKKSLSRSSQARVTMDKFHNLIYGAETAGMFGEDQRLTASTLSLFMERFSAKWLVPQQKTSDLTPEKLRAMKTAYDQWFERQKVINQLFDASKTDEVSLIKMERPNIDHPVIKDWIKLYKNVSLHQWNEKGLAYFERNMRNFTYEAMTISNSLESLIQIMMKPYNLSVAHAEDYVMKKHETQEVYELIRILGVEMAFVDSRIFNSGERAFTEANNFSTQRRSDDNFDYYEVYEHMSIMLSSGALSDRISEDIPESAHMPYRDVLHRPVVEKAEFDKFMMKNFDKYFAHLSVPTKYWREANKEDRQSFLRILEYASRQGVLTDKAVDLGEIRVMVSILYYLESIFYMFDENRDGVAKGAEVRTAEIHFRNFIANLIYETRYDSLEYDSLGFLKRACGAEKTKAELADCVAPLVFLHLLDAGEIPGNRGLALRLHSKYWSNGENAFEGIAASAAEVLRVFSSLAKENHKTHLKSIAAFLVNERKRGELFADLSHSEAPPCRRRDEAAFCRFARTLYCNENINDYLFTYLQENRYTYLRNERWQKEPEAMLADTLEDMTLDFRTPLRSTLCLFPPFQPELASDREAIEDVKDEDIEEPQEKGLWDGVLEWWNGAEEKN